MSLIRRINGIEANGKNGSPQQPETSRGCGSNCGLSCVSGKLSGLRKKDAEDETSSSGPFSCFSDMQKQTQVLKMDPCVARVKARLTSCCTSGPVQEEADSNLTAEQDQVLKVIASTDKIRKQPKDPNEYRWIKLHNGVQVMLVSNPQAKVSAAALDVKVGNFNDPANLQGLCHLCEHVLFTGSETHPTESYSAYLALRGGSSNAYTSSEHTNFHFDVPCEHFEEALERFISFFLCPVFREASVQAELEMVQSEHEKNRFSDVWRTNQVERCTADTSHAFSRFSTGTRQTLEVSHSSDRNLRYELYAFYKANYSGNLMCACLLHNRPISDMEDLAKKLLLAIPNKNIPERIWPRNPFKRHQLKVKVHVVPVKDICHVNLTFPMEDMLQFYAASPQGYVAQLIGHKGPGSLFSHLRRSGLAHHIVASSRTLARGFSFFIVTVQLTDRGERDVDDVIKVVFQYIRLLREAGPLKWFFEEIRKLSVAQFENKETERPQAYASTIANFLHLYPAEDVLVADFVYDTWCPALVDRVFAYLVPDNLRVTLLSKKSHFYATQTEPHYGTEYHVERIPRHLLDAWRQASANAALTLPEPNRLIDPDPQMVPEDPSKEGGMPDLVLMLDRIRMRAWFLPCTRFRIPEAWLFCKFTVPDDDRHHNLAKSTLNSLFLSMVKDLLTEFAYCGELAGLFYTLKPTKVGAELSIRGSSGKQEEFLREVMAAFYCQKAELAQDRFDRVLEVHQRGARSSEAEPLKVQAKHILSQILSPHSIQVRPASSDRLKQLSEIRLSHLQDHAESFRLNLSTECLFFGNLAQGQAEALANVLVDCRRAYLEERVRREALEVPAVPYLEEWFLSDPVERVVLLEEALRAAPPKKTNDEDKDEDQDDHPTDLTRAEYLLPGSMGRTDLFIVHNEVQSSSCVLFYFQFRVNTPPDAALVQVFLQTVRQRLVGSLKNTAVQLGYVAGCDLRTGHCNSSLGFRVVVESQYPLQVVHDAVEAGVADLGRYLGDLTDEAFEMGKMALAAERRELWETRFGDRALALWREVSDSTYRFARVQEEIGCVLGVTLRDCRDFYRSWISAGGENRRHLVISIGPDPILNRLDDVAGPERFWPPRSSDVTEGSKGSFIQSVRHWDLSEVGLFRQNCQIFPVVSDQSLKAWFKSVFESGGAQYGPPV